MARFFRFLKPLFGRPRFEGDMAQEIGFHIETRTQELVRSGLWPAEARRRAKMEFGSLDRYKEECREAHGTRFFDELSADLRYAFRVLRKDRGFALVALLSLGLGIGVNTLVYSVINALLLRPLPVDHPEQLVFLETKQGNPGQSFPNYKDVRDRNSAFAGLLGYRMSPISLETSAGSTRAWGYLATGNYFDVLGVAPALGRFFHQEDDLHPGASPFAVLSYNCWQTRFGADPGIVGKTIRINRLSYTVLGVAPATFHGTELFYWPEIWVPMMMEPQIEVGNPWLDVRRTFNTWVIGRLKPEVSKAQAEASLNIIAAELAHEYPDADDGLSFRLAKPGLIGDSIGSPATAFTLGVLGLAGLVLLAACANLASLLTARTADRQREIAIRLSLGAGRGRVVRQLLTETLLISLAGGCAGYALATLLSNALTAWRAPMDFPVRFDVDTDWRVFVFALAISMVTAVLFGLGPARHVSQTDPNAVLKGGEVNWSTRRRLAFRDVLVALQVALCFVLVCGCLLSLRSLQRALTMSLGFQPRGVATVAFQLGLAGYSEEQGRSFQRRALEAVERLPGARSAAYSNSVPLSIDQSFTTIFPADQPNLRLADARHAVFYKVSPGFFNTLGVRMLAGRDFTWQDDSNSPLVAIVNRALAREILHTEDAIGKRFRYGLGGQLVEVIGIVEDGKYESLTELPRPAVYKSILQAYNPTTTLLVRSTLPESEMVGEMRQSILRIDPQLPLYATGSLEQMLGLALFPTRAAAIMLSAFGVLAIVLAGTGIQGLVAYAVSRRAREIGIRVAVGARPSQVLRLVVSRIAVLVLAGAVFGLVLALAAGQVLASIVYQASPRDPLVFIGVTITMILVGILSCWAPARRALRIDPVSALRSE